MSCLDVCSCSTQRAQKRAVDSTELDGQMVVRHHVDTRKISLGSSSKKMLLTAKPSLRSLNTCFGVSSCELILGLVHRNSLQPGLQIHFSKNPSTSL